jgi:hypothetical protein
MEPLAAPLGALATMAIAAAMVPLRETAFGNTNAALVLVVVVAATASIGGRGAGALAAFTAALSFNFLLTRPYLSLKVNDSTDLTTVVLLLVVGLLIGEFARQRGLRVHQLRRSTETTHRLERVAALMATEHHPEDLHRLVVTEVIAELELIDATWVPAGDDRVRDLPVLDRSGWIEGGSHRYRRDGFELPSQGVALPVRYAGALLGTLLLTPSPGVGTSPDQRSVAVALADLLATELAHRTAPGTSPVA